LELHPTTAVDGGERVRRAVVVFTRAPEDEQNAKPLLPTPRLPTRGTRDTRAHTAALHRQLIDHALSAAAAVTDADVLLVTTSDLGRASEAALHQVPADRLHVFAQSGSTFAERFETAVHQAFTAGYGQVVVIGSDTPELGAVELQEAFARLTAGAPHGAVLGPSHDGGYYLLGLSAFSRAAFAGIAFGGPHVAAETAVQLERAGYAVSLLAPLTDIDRAADLGAVATRLCTRQRPGDALLCVALLLVLSIQTASAPHEPPRPRSLGEFLPRDTRGPPLT
jgi:rSAM/selenodomain-associated transferase 1